ncbi:MAG: helix-turn-helix transcriptional regulator [Angelakisella sp.]
MVTDKDQKKLTTTQLMDHLRRSQTVSDALAADIGTAGVQQLHHCLKELTESYGVSVSQIIFETNLSKSFVYQLFSGERNAGRDIILRMAFAMGLSVKDTQRLLSASNNGSLYPRVRRDAAIIFCLNKKLTLTETCELLDGLSEESLQ